MMGMSVELDQIRSLRFANMLVVLLCLFVTDLYGCVLRICQFRIAGASLNLCFPSLLP